MPVEQILRNGKKISAPKINDNIRYALSFFPTNELDYERQLFEPTKFFTCATRGSTRNQLQLFGKLYNNSISKEKFMDIIIPYFKNTDIYLFDSDRGNINSIFYNNHRYSLNSYNTFMIGQSIRNNFH
jgi:hypothetical protein